MAMHLSSGGGRTSSFRRSYRPMSDINVTPFVDVMLVLLIVFMVTAPLLTVGIPVDLPESTAPSLSETKDPIVITIGEGQKIYIQETPVEMKSLAPKLAQITNQNTEARIYVRGDRKVKYGEVMQVMGQITEAGYSKVALVAEMPSLRQT